MDPQAQPRFRGPRFEELVQRSLDFESSCCAFPTSENRISAIVTRAGAGAGAAAESQGREQKEEAEAEVRRQVEEDAQGARVLVHWRVWRLLGEFLAWKTQWGTEEEQALYRGMDRLGLARRLITQRPLTFMTSKDFTKLRDGLYISSGTSVWDALGNAKGVSGTQGDPVRLSLADYLSYDEMQVSALLGTSTPTFFINSGSRGNCAVPGAPGSFETHGVYLGLVGARFERCARMEDEWVVVRKPDERLKLPLRQGEAPEAAAARARMWMRGFGVPEDYWQQTVEPLLLSMSDSGPPDAGVPEHMVHLNRRELFNTYLYKARMCISAETALMEADARARAERRRAYLHVVGLGLGVWELHPEQAEWFTDVFAEALNSVRLPNLHTIDFSWFSGASSCGRFRTGSVTDCANGNQIRIVFSKRDPAAPLGVDERGHPLLLVATYAWDGNSFPGNEFWMRSLSASGDPAAACCSTIGELQNPLINDFAGNIAVLDCSGDGEPNLWYPNGVAL